MTLRAIRACHEDVIVPEGYGIRLRATGRELESPLHRDVVVPPCEAAHGIRAEVRHDSHIVLELQNAGVAAGRRAAGASCGQCCAQREGGLGYVIELENEHTVAALIRAREHKHAAIVLLGKSGRGSNEADGQDAAGPEPASQGGGEIHGDLPVFERYGVAVYVQSKRDVHASKFAGRWEKVTHGGVPTSQAGIFVRVRNFLALSIEACRESQEGGTISLNAR